MPSKMPTLKDLFCLSLATSTAFAQYHSHRSWRPVHHADGDRVNNNNNNNRLLQRSVSLQGQTVTITDNSRTESTVIPEIVVFTDGSGNPVSTATAVVALVPPTDTPQAKKAARGADISVAASLDEHKGKTNATMERPADVSALQGSLPWNPHQEEHESGDTSRLSSRAGGTGLFGVAYAPYNADGSCKSASQVMSDFGVLGKTYGMVRVYGVDCNQIPAVYAAAKANKLRIMYGIFSLDNLGDQIATLTSGINSDWSNVDTVSIGNELVNNGQASPQQILDALAAGRQILASAGWTGPVVTVDTFVAALAHPELCSASDYCAVNIHPFFDPNTSPSSAGTFVLNMVQALRTKLGNPSARVRVTESGWPWQGSANAQAVPGVDQQAVAVSSIQKAFAANPEDMVLFSAFNDRWKTAAEATFFAEQFWGMGMGDAPSA